MFEHGVPKRVSQDEERKKDKDVNLPVRCYRALTLGLKGLGASNQLNEESMGGREGAWISCLQPSKKDTHKDVIVEDLHA